MNRWGAPHGDDRQNDEPEWVAAVTWEWEPLPGRRYPGDPGRRTAGQSTPGSGLPGQYFEGETVEVPGQPDKPTAWPRPAAGRRLTPFRPRPQIPTDPGGGRPAAEPSTPTVPGQPTTSGQAGQRSTSPAAHVYGSARQAPLDAFPAYPDTLAYSDTSPTSGRPGAGAPFHLRPVPQIDSPVPSRPAPQPTRVTPGQPAHQPTPSQPSVPGQTRRQSTPAKPPASAAATRVPPIAMPPDPATPRSPAESGPAGSGPAGSNQAGSNQAEEHGLGWLLSMSGLGATTPVSDATDVLAEGPAVNAPAPADVEPVKPSWFAPRTGEMPIARPANRPADQGDPIAASPAAEEPATADLTPTDPIDAQPPEPIDVQPNQENLDDTVTSAEVVDAEVVEGSPDDEEIVDVTPTHPELSDSELVEVELVADHTFMIESGPQEVVDAELVDIEPVGATWAEASLANTAPASPATAAPARRRSGALNPNPTSRRADPEEILSSYPWSFNPETLREQVDDTDLMWVVVDRLTDKLEYAERDAVRARLLSLRAVALRLLGELDDALADARKALDHARATGEIRRTAIVQVRLAHVLHWRGEYAEADRLYAEADSPELPTRLRAGIYELAGRSAVEQGRFLEAMNHLERAVDLHNRSDPELVDRVEIALDAIVRRTGGDWGPYPRTRHQILGHAEPVVPQRDEASGLWGYPDALPPRYAQAQPFAEGLAWVRRPGAPAWELIASDGTTVIGSAAGYLAAERFSEGLAWVSGDRVGGWHAIDRENRLIVPGGFDDAKPFHRGLALIRRGAWGAIDRHGQMVVQPRYRRIVTKLIDGGPVDGFTDEGLAVVDAGDRYGVVDRTGQFLVAPVHADIVVHPVAFLICDRYGLWGALDRTGEPLIELKHSDQAAVVNEIDRLLTHTRPVL